MGFGGLRGRKSNAQGEGGVWVMFRQRTVAVCIDFISRYISWPSLIFLTSLRSTAKKAYQVFLPRKSGIS